MDNVNRLKGIFSIFFAGFSKGIIKKENLAKIQEKSADIFQRKKGSTNRQTLIFII